MSAAHKWALAGAAAVLVGSFLPFISSISLVGGDILPRARTTSAVFGVILLGLALGALSRRANLWGALLAVAGALGVFGYGGFIAAGYSGIKQSDGAFGLETELTFRPNVGIIACVVGCAICALAAIAILRKKK